jgi:UDP-glucose 4-epimerase
LPSSDATEIATVTSWYTTAFNQLLNACLKAKIDQLVFVSSGGTIYGENPARSPVDEDYPTNAKCAYGSFCAFLEHTLRRYHSEFGLPFTILRLGNPYGSLKRPHKDQGLIDHYIRSARAGKPFTIFGDGSEVRDYIYIDDISQLITRVLSSASQNDTFNIGTGHAHTSTEVIAGVRNYFDLPEVPIVFGNRRSTDVGCSLLNMEKFERTFGERCNISLEEGLRRYAELEVRGA